jgi:hypothetical protein
MDRSRLAQCQRRQGWALVVTGASTMLAGLVIGYAFGTAQSLGRALVKGNHGN